MTKFILPFFLLALTTSCKKVQTCECFGETGVLLSTHKIKETRKNAREKCNPYEIGYDGNFEGYCELKMFK